MILRKFIPFVVLIASVLISMTLSACSGTDGSGRQSLPPQGVTPTVTSIPVTSGIQVTGGCQTKQNGQILCTLQTGEKVIAGFCGGVTVVPELNKPSMFIAGPSLQIWGANHQYEEITFSPSSGCGYVATAKGGTQIGTEEVNAHSVVVNTKDPNSHQATITYYEDGNASHKE